MNINLNLAKSPNELLQILQPDTVQHFHDDMATKAAADSLPNAINSPLFPAQELMLAGWKDMDNEERK